MIREKIGLLLELLLVLPVVVVGGWLWNRTGGLADTIVGGSFTHNGTAVTTYVGLNLDGTVATVSAFPDLSNLIVKGIFWVVAIAVVGFIIYKLVKHKEGE